MNGDNQNPDFSCSLCKTLHASDWELKEHIWSLLHHVKLEQKEKKNAVVHECILCQTKCKNLVDYGRHLNEEGHKQALEKAKERKKTKPKSSSSASLSTPSRYILQKFSRQRQKLKAKSLVPNPNWHLNPVNSRSLSRGGQNKFFNYKFPNWKPGNWYGKGNSLQQSQFPHANPNPFFKSNQFWNDSINNDSDFISFCRDAKDPHERLWKNNPKVIPTSNVKMNDSIKRSDTSHSQSLTASKRYTVPLNVLNSQKKTPDNTLSPAPLTPPSLSKNSETVPDSKNHSVNPHLPPSKTQSLPTKNGPSKVSSSTHKNTNSTKLVKSKRISPADPVSPKPKVNTSPQVGSKATANISKPKTKVLSKSKVPVSSKSVVKEKQPIADNKKVTVATAKQALPSPPKKEPSKDKKLSETQQISSVDSKSLPTTSPELRNVGNPKNFESTNLSKGCESSSVPSSTKRQYYGTDAPDLSSSSSDLNPSKKQKILPKQSSIKSKLKVNPTASLSPFKGKKNLVEKSNPSVSIDPSSSQNNEIVKEKSAKEAPDSGQEPKKPKTAVPNLEKKENSFKVNEELVTKLRKKLISQYPINPLPLKTGPKSSGISGDNDANSKDEMNSSLKLSTANIRQEELVKMMKLPRLNRKEKMHLSSLLQSYTKSQNKKLAAPRLTMQLSGLYDTGGQDGGEMSELDLPGGMEEQITYLIKRENLEELSDEVLQRDWADFSDLEKVGLQATRLKDIPISVTHQNNPNKEKTDERKIEKTSVKTSSIPCEIEKASSEGQHSSKKSLVNEASPSENPSLHIQDENVLNANTIENSSRLDGGHSPSINSSTEPSFHGQADPLNSPSTATAASQPPAPSNPDRNTENIFNQVYLLTLREEQIRSSIVDMNEKMNYLRRLIEDSQMALQGCSVEHKRLLEEESEIRGERLQILQKAMNSKAETRGVDGSNPSSSSSSLLPHPVILPPVHGSGPATPGPYSQQANQSCSSQQQSSKNQSEEIAPQQKNKTISEVTDGEVVSSINSSQAPFNNSYPLNRLSNIPTVQCQGQPTGVAANSNPTLQNQSPVPSLYLSLGNNNEKSMNNGASETRNSCENVSQRQGSNIGFESVVIKQERCTPPASPKAASIEKTLLSVSENVCDINPQNLNGNNNGNPVLLTSRAISKEVHQQAPSSKNAKEPSSVKGQKQARPLPPTENKTPNFEMVQIKKEPVLAEEPNEGYLSQAPKDTLSGHQRAPIAAIQSQVHETTKEVLTSKSDDLLKGQAKRVSSLGIEGQKECSIPNPREENSRLEPMAFDFSSVQIKEEPLTPPPATVERLFDSELSPRNEEESERCGKGGTNSEAKAKDEEVAKNVCSFSMGRNAVLEPESGNVSLEAEAQTEARNLTPEKSPSTGMSMTYLGSMPNDFLQQLTLSWSKQKSSPPAVNNCVGGPNRGDERSSFSDGDFPSDQTGRKLLNNRSSPSKLDSVPKDMNPRVCLERLDMRSHRKRTLSEPVSAGRSDPPSSSSSSSNDGSEENGKEDQDGSEHFETSPMKRATRMSLDENLDIEEGPRVRRKNLRRKSLFPKKKKSDAAAAAAAALPSEPTTPCSNNECAVINLCTPEKGNPDESKGSISLPADSSSEIDLVVDQNNSVVSSSSNISSSPPKPPANVQLNSPPSEINFPLKPSSDPLNILNNLNLLHVVRTKKFSWPPPPRQSPPPAPQAISKKSLPTYKGASSPVNGLQILDNHLYVSYQGNSPCKFAIETGECLQVYNCKPYSVQCMLVCQIGNSRARLFSGGASELLLIFDEATGNLCSQIDTCKKIYSLHENWGHVFVGLAEGGITKINQKSLRKLSELSYGNKPINCLASCTEGAQKLLFVGAYDASILIVDAVTGLLLKTLNCYHRLLYSIKVHRNLIFSCSSDKTLQVHDITSGKLLHCLQDHSSTISCLHVEDDLLVTGSHDKCLNVYDSINPRGSPLTFFSGSKEAVSCLAVHDGVIYCGNFFGHIEAIRFDLRRKWTCEFGACKSVFGQSHDLLYHLTNGHFKRGANVDTIQCLWHDCGADILSIVDIIQHCKYHISHIRPPKEVVVGEN